MLNFLKKFKSPVLFSNQRFLSSFTLIELLVVVAIIGLLTSMSLVVGREARDRGRNTKIQSSLSQVRFEAALIHNNDDSYTNLCDGSNTLNQANDNLSVVEDEVRKYSGSDPSCYVSADGNSYCVQSSLITGGAYCLDSTGYAGQVANCTSANIQCSP